MTLCPITLQAAADHLNEIASAMWERVETYREDPPTNAEREDATTAYIYEKAAESVLSLIGSVRP